MSLTGTIRAALMVALVSCQLPISAQSQPEVSMNAKTAPSSSLRSYSIKEPKAESGIVHRDLHMVKPLPKPKSTEQKVIPDKALQHRAQRRFNASVIVEKDGIGDGSDYRVESEPPDTVGAAGSTQFVQWVNTSIRVFDKQTLKPLALPALGNALWKGFGGNCEAYNDGDPVVLYDRLDPHDGRWVISQFAISGGDPGKSKPYSQCIAVSKTDDALGEYQLYEFQFKNFNDYGKLGTWPDGYYGAFNMFDQNNAFLGSRVCAFQRDAMRQGLPAQMECFDISTGGGLLPADFDGVTPPPNSTPEYFLNVDLSGNKLNIWKFKASWGSQAAPTIDGPTAVSVSPFNLACDSCVPQLGSPTTLNTLGDRLMFRLSYRNWGDHGSLLTNHAVAAGGATAIRWYELVVDPSQSPDIRVKQQGTFSPDASHRWIGSMAMDKMGNIALGYSKSSAQMHPSVMLTGRGPSDPPDTLNSEVTIVKGTGSQQGVDRWGDYSSMTVDPADDCTLFFTTAYLLTTGQYDWHTAIAKIKFPGCM